MDADEEMAIAVHDEQVAENKRLREALHMVVDWHDGELEDNDWNKVISAVRRALKK